ncbi:MAG: hypothetical protein K6G68_05890 [Oscillospiraceae bacterium]|jgi:hypothetical protein|nr:hypothetical protein [Oscillospiraceae bacterium]MBQ4486363.1 hypothetical protein [Oscillospiraceae bacterium]MCR5806551.1 hypothetical protein [Oscillospiraceae bacterium]
MTENEQKFYSYKGYPLVRVGNQIYYGSMNDKYVVMLQILESKKINDTPIATKIRLYKMATDEKLSPMEAIVKQSEKPNLYSALDIAYAWLGIQN